MKIAVKEQELLTLDEKKELEKESVAKETLQLVELEKQRIGKASEYLVNNKEVEVEPLKVDAEKVVEMQGYLRDWDRMLFIRDGELAIKRNSANT